jgi:hypothetical protein
VSWRLVAGDLWQGGKGGLEDLHCAGVSSAAGVDVGDVVVGSGTPGRVAGSFVLKQGAGAVFEAAFAIAQFTAEGSDAEEIVTVLQGLGSGATAGVFEGLLKQRAALGTRGRRFQGFRVEGLHAGRGSFAAKGLSDAPGKTDGVGGFMFLSFRFQGLGRDSEFGVLDGGEGGMFTKYVVGCEGEGEGIEPGAAGSDLVTGGLSCLGEDAEGTYQQAILG